MLFYEPETRDRKLLPHDPFKAIVAPRPIGWISTIGRDGAVNLAPYSFFQAISTRPPIVAFCSEGLKDTLAFARESGEFVCNMATFALRDAMNATAATLPRGDNEFIHAGLAMAPCRLIRPPRVAASPAALECRVVDILPVRDLAGESGERWLVTGQVIGIHLDEHYVLDGRLDLSSIQPLARCGYLSDYAVVERIVSLDRPD